MRFIINALFSLRNAYFYCTKLILSMDLVLLQRTPEDNSNGILFDIVHLHIFCKQWIMREDS